MRDSWVIIIIGVIVVVEIIMVTTVEIIMYSEIATTMLKQQQQLPQHKSQTKNTPNSKKQSPFCNRNSNTPT